MWVSMPKRLRIHLPILNIGEKYNSTEKSLHGPQVWCNWKQLYRFFPTVLITHMVFLNTEINDSSLFRIWKVLQIGFSSLAF